MRGSLNGHLFGGFSQIGGVSSADVISHDRRSEEYQNIRIVQVISNGLGIISRAKSGVGITRGGFTKRIRGLKPSRGNGLTTRNGGRGGTTRTFMADLTSGEADAVTRVRINRVTTANLGREHGIATTIGTSLHRIGDVTEPHLISVVAVVSSIVINSGMVGRGIIGTRLGSLKGVI